MFVLISSIIFAILGTLISLRLSWVDRLEGNNNLTRRGRIVFAITTGLAIGIILILIDGSWWTCDANNVCTYVWGL